MTMLPLLLSLIANAAAQTLTVSTPPISPSGFYDDITEWLSPSNMTSQPQTSKQTILDNISVNGSLPGLVIAAQSWVHPDYAYHWTRDAALVYSCLCDLYAESEDLETTETIGGLFEEYVERVLEEQEDPTAIGGIGEPKFYLGNNSGYQGSWGRPQNDGPALRVSTMLQFAEAGAEVDGLWKAVTADLDYLTDNWEKANFDPWEEVNGTHFFNRMVQRRAFMDASSYAASINETELAEEWHDVAWEIQKTLYDFYDYRDHQILCSMELLHNKTSYLDVSVILAFNHAFRAPDSFSPMDAYALSTAYLISTSFIDVYPISATHYDDDGLPLAPPTGRYPEDVYDGYDTSEGNPWFLSCCAFAEYFYKLGKMCEDEGEIVLSQVSMPFWVYFTGANSSAAALRDADFDDTVQRLYGWGDAFMRTVKYYGDGFEYSEQFNKYTGEEQGAKQLTWSHAAILTAAFARAQAMGEDEYISLVAES